MNVSDMYNNKVTVTLPCPGLTCLVCSPSSCGEFFFTVFKLSDRSHIVAAPCWSCCSGELSLLTEVWGSVCGWLVGTNFPYEWWVVTTSSLTWGHTLHQWLARIRWHITVWSSQLENYKINFRWFLLQNHDKFVIHVFLSLYFFMFLFSLLYSAWTTPSYECLFVDGI